MELLVVLVAIFAVSHAARIAKREAVKPQVPKVWDALAKLRGKVLSIEDIDNLLANSQPGVDYPILSEIPESKFACDSQKQPGFYADTTHKCQVIRRCDINGDQTSYLCPNMTLFNQITLVCDWWYNVDCSQAESFYDYSNSRLYISKDVHLLDDQDEIMEAIGAVAKPASSSASSSSSSEKKKSKA